MVSSAPAARARQPYEHLWIVLAMVIPATILAFAPSYVGKRTFSGLPFTALGHVHSGLMALWLVMLVLQAWFVRTGRWTLHRLVGRSSYAIVPLMVALTTLLAHETLNRRPVISAFDARVEIFDLMQVLGIVLAWALGIAYRRRVELHVRFMVSTLFAMGSAILFRLLINWFSWVPGLDMAEDPGNFDHLAIANGSILVLALLGLIAADWRRGIRCSPFWLVTVTTLVLHVGLFTFALTDGWASLVSGFAALPL